MTLQNIKLIISQVGQPNEKVMLLFILAYFYRIYVCTKVNPESTNGYIIVGYIINDVLVSDGQFTIVNVGTN